MKFKKRMWKTNFGVGNHFIHLFSVSILDNEVIEVMEMSNVILVRLFIGYREKF